MNIRKNEGTLNVAGPRELNSANAHMFHSTVATALSQDLEVIEIDLAQTLAVDGAGLGALVALHESATSRLKREGFAMRLTNPTPTVQQMIELTRLHRLYEIAPSSISADGTIQISR